jgi:hypothetical protein
MEEAALGELAAKMGIAPAQHLEGAKQLQVVLERFLFLSIRFTII